jgi:predicted nicotinamide N-methyase
MTEVTINDKVLRLQSVDFVPEINLYLCDTPHYRTDPSERFPCYPYAWVGGKALARYILDNPSIVAGKTVVDLCAGSGIVAIAAKLAGATRVVAVDDYNYSIEAIQLNADANGVAIETVQEDVFNYSPDYGDVFLVGDPFYDEALLPYLKANFDPVLVGSPIRHSYYTSFLLDPLQSYTMQSPIGFDEQLSFNTHICWLSD